MYLIARIVACNTRTLVLCTRRARAHKRNPHHPARGAMAIVWGSYPAAFVDRNELPIKIVR